MIAALGNYVIVDKRWLRATLPEVHRDADRRTLERFATWHLRRRLQTFADRGPVTGNQTQQAREEARQAIAFLAWLRDRDRDLSSCGQADIDAWYAGTYIARRRTHAFLRWAMSNKLLRRVTIPHQDTRNPMPVSQQQRLRVIRRLLTDEDMPLLTRVAAVLMLLYAQPLTRILRLRLDDVTEHDGQVAIRLGDPPTPVPAPFAELLLRHRRSRPNLITATNPDAPWLFPGRRGAQPMTPTALEKRLRQQGIPDDHRPHGSPAAPRSPSTGTRGRPHARLHPRPHRPAGQRGRRNLEPLRTRRSLSVSPAREHATVDHASSPVPHPKYVSPEDRHTGAWALYWPRSMSGSGSAASSRRGRAAATLPACPSPRFSARCASSVATSTLSTSWSRASTRRSTPWT